jgi:hypothetical protein
MWEQKEEAKPECVKSCGRAPVVEDIYLDYYVFAKIEVLMKKYTNLEWLAYLIGEDNIVRDIYIPKQKVTGAAVNDIEGNPEIPIIGVVHSHHHLGLHSFSGTDHAYINDNHALSILVWHEKDGSVGINGQKKVTLDCGANMIVPIKIIYFHPELNEPEWVAEAESNIQEKVYTYTAPPNYGGGLVGVGRYYDPAASEKKSGSSSRSTCGNWNVPKGRIGVAPSDAKYEDYLEKLVHDDGFVGLGVQDSEFEIERPEEEVLAHFQKIDDDARGYLGVNRHNITTFRKDDETGEVCEEDTEPIENPWV